MNTKLKEFFKKVAFIPKKLPMKRSKRELKELAKILVFGLALGFIFGCYAFAKVENFFKKKYQEANILEKDKTDGLDSLRKELFALNKQYYSKCISEVTAKPSACGLLTISAHKKYSELQRKYKEKHRIYEVINKLVRSCR